MKVKNIYNIIFIALLIVAVSTPLMTTSSYAAKYNVNKAVKYAEDWARRYNDSQYKRIKENCTNFVSQCLVAGGKGFVKPTCVAPSYYEWIRGYVCISDSNRWFNKKYTIKRYGISRKEFIYSKSFTFVGDFYNFWKKQRCCTTYGEYTSAAKNNALQKTLRKGDILQMWDKGQGWHHSMIVTFGTRGNWRYCANTDPAYREYVSNLNKKNRKFRIIRINY